MISTALRTVLAFAFLYTLAAEAQPRGSANKKITEKASAGAIKVEGANSEIIDKSAIGSQGPQLKFNTEAAPTNTDHRETIKFKGMDDYSNTSKKTEEAPKPILEFSSNEDEGFKSYIGYPKHEIHVLAGSDNIAATWGYNGQDFTFRSSTIAYGVNYTFVGTPMWKLGVHYSRYSVGVDAGTISGFSIKESEETLDQYGVNSEYCFISSANFYRQYCLGGTILNDSYPILKFTSGTDLEMGRVDDIVVGVHVAAQIPFSDKIFFKPILGYNYGTGAGNSGALTAEGNSKFWFRAELPWSIARRFTLKLHADYSARQATIKGKIGNNNDKWETDSTIVGGGLDAIFVF